MCWKQKEGGLPKQGQTLFFAFAPGEQFDDRTQYFALALSSKGISFALHAALHFLFFQATAVMKLACCLLRLPALLLAFPLVASATIYKWTDERGTTVFSDRLPKAGIKMSNVQVVVEDDEPAAAPKPDNGNALQERVRALEQQVQALQTQASAHLSNYAAPYSAQLPPTDYYPPPYYPSAYPPPMYGYGYPYYPYAYPSFVVVAPRRFFRPVHGFGVHRFSVRPFPVTHVMGFTHRR
jgi:hypothetical protein